MDRTDWGLSSLGPPTVASYNVIMTLLILHNQKGQIHDWPLHRRKGIAIIGPRKKKWALENTGSDKKDSLAAAVNGKGQGNNIRTRLH